MPSHMIIEHLVVGPLSVNCYILACETTRKAAVIDPGDEGQRILAKAEMMGVEIVSIINTHGHFDHIGANSYLKNHTNAKLIIHDDDNALLPLAAEHGLRYGITVAPSPKPDLTVSDGDVIEVGNLRVKVIDTPGHSPGGICLLVENSLFSGDTLFAESIGRTDLPGGNFDQLISSIKLKLLTLPGDIKVYPGHGEDTTIKREEQANPFIKGEAY